jgi:hypothetical protein
MVVHDLDVAGTTFRPNETNAEPLVDANTVLAPSITQKAFQPVSWRYSEFLQLLDGIELIQFASRDSPKVGRAGTSGLSTCPSVEDILRAFILE